MNFQDVPEDQWTVRVGPKVTEIPPKACPNGHPLTDTVVAWLPCGCAGGDGHRTYQCLKCGATIYRPPHTPGTSKSGDYPNLP